MQFNDEHTDGSSTNWYRRSTCGNVILPPRVAPPPNDFEVREQSDPCQNGLGALIGNTVGPICVGIPQNNGFGTISINTIFKIHGLKVDNIADG